MGLFAASGLVFLAGVIVTGLVWIGLTRLLNHRWPWDAALARGQNPASTLDLTKVALSVVAGVGAAIALTVTYRRQRDLERGRFDERFAAAAAQLGADNAAQRLAGVYAIGALADENPGRRQQCIDLLCAYLRLPYDPAAGLLRTVVSEHSWPVGSATGREQRTYERLPNDRDVRFAIIALMAGHLRPQAKTSWSAYDYDFTGALFDGGDFSGLTFSGRNVSFYGADFSGGRVDFNHATLSGELISFSRTTFSGGEVTFDEAIFSGGQVAATEFPGSPGINFNEATFSGGVLTFGDANLCGRRISFEGAAFTGGRVTRNGSEFSGNFMT